MPCQLKGLIEVNDNFGIYFVLNGLMNGAKGVLSLNHNDDEEEDGWYARIGDEDVSFGPYDSLDDATDAAVIECTMRSATAPMLARHLY